MKRIVRFILTEWNEFITIPLGLLLFFVFPYLIRAMDPTSAPYDAGVLHSFVAAICGMLIIHGFAWLLLRISFPGIYHFLDTLFEEHINRLNTFNNELNGREKFLNLSVWQKCLLAFWVFALYLLGTILLAKIF